MKDLLREAIVVYSLLVLVYYLLLNSGYFILMVIACRELFRYKKRLHHTEWLPENQVFTPMISILSPAHNEALTVIESIESVLNLSYPNIEAIVINDGSDDDTLKRLIEHFRLFPVKMGIPEKLPTKPVRMLYRSELDIRLLVIDKENGGKADALNAGINHARGRLFCTIDSDSIIERDALSKLMHLYLERDTKVIALGGVVRVANECRLENGEMVSACLPNKFVPAIQVMEYIRAFICGRTGWNGINALLIISGAFGLFERQMVMSSGGYRTDNVGEDMELVVRLHRIMREKGEPYRVVFVPDPVCWTQVPESLASLRRQRNRWQRGLLETLALHRRMLFNPRYGLTGMIAMPYNFFFEVIGPIIEVSGYVILIVAWAFGWINWDFCFLFIILAVLFGVMLSIFSLLIEEIGAKRYNNISDLLRLFMLAVMENLGYRQLNSWWRLFAIIDYFRKEKTWGEIRRVSFQSEEQPA